MDKYTASNKVTVWRDSSSGRLQFSGQGVDLDVLREKLAGGLYGMRPSEELAAREFFQAERDEELGRWRSPVNSDEVVYRDGDDSVLVVDERTGAGEQLERWEADLLEKGAAFDYFEAHPVRQPWDDAETGEFWELWLTGATVRVKAVAGYEAGRRVFYADQGNVYASTDADISHAERIWPPEA